MPLNFHIPHIFGVHRHLFVVHLSKNAELNSVQWDVVLIWYLWDLTNTVDQWMKKPLHCQSVILICEGNLLSKLVTILSVCSISLFSICPLFAFIGCTQEQKQRGPRWEKWIQQSLLSCTRLSAERDLIQSKNASGLVALFNHIKSNSELMVSNLFCVCYDSLSKALQ